MEINLIIKAFLFGLSGSFTHCLGMCGGIALGQNALRLIQNQSFVSPLQRFLAALSWEYYLGKSLSYAIISLILLLISRHFYSNPWLILIKKTAIVTVILYLIYNLWGILQPKTRNCKKTLVPSFVKKITKFNLFICGILLGFIPCGLVYSMITMVLAGSDNPMVVFIGAFFLA
jgi:sulfite exporter TauE/SafE